MSQNSPDRARIFEELGERLKAARTKAGLTLDAAGALVGVRRQAVWNWENATSEVGEYELQKLAHAYGMTPAELRYGIEKAPQGVEEAMEAGARLYIRRLLELLHRDLGTPAMFEFPEAPMDPVEWGEQGKGGKKKA